jgi:hypothetical protein
VSGMCSQFLLSGSDLALLMTGFNRRVWKVEAPNVQHQC